MKITCTRKIEFDAGHRVMEHENKCKKLHGHRYVIEASFIADDLDKIGRIIDFGEIKEILQKWIDDNFDHNIILHKDDKKLGELIEQQITDQKIYYLPYNPTAENIAAYLLKEICPKLFSEKNVKCFKIKLFETPNCWAEANL